MANVKITDLTELAAIDVATNDVLPIVDVNNDSTKKVTISSLTTSVADANDFATYTILNANIDVVSGNADAFYTQLNANIDVVQSNVSALSSVLRISNTGTTDDVTVGTDDLIFAGTNGLTPLITNDTVTFQLDDTAVTAGLYGGVEGTTTNVAVITVDAQGRITAASNATVAVDLATLESNVNTVQDNVVLAEANVTAVETRRADNVFFTYNATGDQANVIINSANVEPSQNNIFSLGAPDKVWKELYVGPGSIKIGNVTLSAVETGLKIEDAAGDTTQIDTSVANVTANLNLIQDNVNAVSQDVSALETRRDDNVTIRINAFTGTNAAIVAAESRLNSNLDVTNDNVTTLTTTVDNFGTSSNSNAAALASEDAALQSRLSTNVTALTNEDTALQSRLSTNVTAFTNEDTALQSRLTTNVTAFTNEDTALQARIAANALVAASNDYITYTRLNANVDVVQDNVTTLTTTVDNFGTSSNANATALALEDVALQTRLGANVTSLQNEDTALQTRLSTNVTAFTNEDTALQSRLSSNVTSLQNEDTALQSRLSSNVTSLQNEDTALQTRIAANALVAASNDYVTYTRLNANVDVVQDNVATLTTTVDNFGTSSNTNAAALASGIVASEVRINANLDVTNDNVANITDGTTPFSAPVTFTDNVTISGSLIVTGAQVDLGVQSATVDNNFIELSAELAPGDTPATDSGLLINRGNRGNVFIGDHLGEDGVIFVRTQTPDTNTTVAIESFMDLHANMFHAAGPSDLGRVHFGLRDAEDTGIVIDDSEANINFVVGGSYVANVHYDGTLNSQNAIIAPAVFAGGVELQANDSATLFSARANDFATYTLINANVDVVQDNVATLTTTVDNHGTYSNTNFDTKANVSATFIQLNANVDVVQDNVAAAESNVSAVESRRIANIAGAVSTITTGNLTASRALASDGSGKIAVSAVTSTELGYLDGVTSAIQTQLNAKQSTITGAATTIDDTNLTASRALVSDGSGKVAVSAVTSTELGYLDGVSSAIQTQIDSKISTASSASNDYITYTQLNANLNVVQDNVDTKLDSSSYTASDVLTKIKTVDGSGSGLDADLLDGQSSAYYAVESTRSSNAAQLAAGIASVPTGDITAVTAGSGLTGGGTTGSVTLNIGAGTGVTVNADDIAIGQAVGTGNSPTFAGLTVNGTFDLGALS